MLDKMMGACYDNICSAGLAHLVERHLAKVEVASSSLVARSKNALAFAGAFLFLSCRKNSLPPPMREAHI